ncbi:MAG: hypothetical protein QOH96_2388, partial [Blastocatellia bacterium]|nr:hypothetical protein [Blastocatellia bacterium]
MNLTIKHYSAVAFALVAAILVFVFVVSYRNSASAIQNFAKVEHSREILRTLSSFELEIKDVETGHRRYVTTGNAEYLEQYKSAAAALAKDSDALKALTSDEPLQQIRLVELQPLVGQL